MGLEPTTPCLQSRCSSQLSYVPVRDASCYGCASHGDFRTLTGVLRDLVDPLWLPLVVLSGAWVYVWRRGGVVRWIRIVTAAREPDPSVSGLGRDGVDEIGPRVRAENFRRDDELAVGARAFSLEDHWRG